MLLMIRRRRKRSRKELWSSLWSLCSVVVRYGLCLSLPLSKQELFDIVHLTLILPKLL